ncbi:MAG TPA: SRPBCC domain-containing protein [Chitinophagales bacterium]|nr:SRPBCC domain-containing protein [Chitinophagales bacterium]
MAKEIKTEILINAKIETVWKKLTDFKNYPNWNPFIKSVRGNIRVGKKIEIKVAPPEESAMVFKPKILVFEEEKELRWLGHFLFKGLFDGEHKFELISTKDGKTLFRQSEVFNGLLVPLLAKQLDNNTKRGFELMNQKLKEISERACAKKQIAI